MKVTALLFAASLNLVAGTGCGTSSAAPPAAALKEDTVFEFVGRVDQTDLSLASYGYLSHVSGLSDADLFSAAFPAWNESTAKFTFRTDSTLTSRFIIPAVFSVAGSGATTYYFTNTPSGNFADPATFTTGTAIATSSGRYGDVNTVIAAGQGVISGSGQVTQATASPVTVGGNPFTLGAAGTLLRITYSGMATRQGTTNNSTTYLSGRATTIR